MSKEYDIEKINRMNFRSSLEALARPGEPQQLIPLFDSGLLAMASVLLYAESSYHYEGTLEFQLIQAISGSQPSPPATADYLFCDSPRKDLLNMAKTGTPENPEDSATFLFSNNGGTSDKTNVILSGPGVNGSRELVLPFSYGFIESLMEKNESFPMGVDLFFISSNTDLFGLPRTTKIEVIQ